MSLYDDASLIMFPSGYKEDKIYSLKPTDGSGDLTFTRASTATRVNAEGLVETASVLGSEQITNGDFATNSDWTLTQATIINGAANISTSGSLAGIVQSNVTTSGKTYKFNIEITNIQTLGSGISLTSGGLTSSILNTFTTLGTHTVYFTATSTTIGIKRTNGATDITIDNVSVKEVITLNVPRIDYTGGGCGKLLLEPQRTNLTTYSEDFANANWVAIDASVTTNAIISPDGTQNADKLNTNTTNNYHRIVANAQATATTAHTMSIFAKKGEYKYIGIAENNNDVGYGVFDLNAGTVLTSGSGATNVTIQNMGNGWYRCQLTFTAGAYSRFDIYAINDSYTSGNPAAYSFVGSSSNGLYIYGAQLEANASYVSSYIPTLASSVTRLADAASKTGISSLIGQTEGAIFFDGVINGVGNTSTNIINSEKNTTCSFYIQRVTASSQINAGFIFSGTSTAVVNGGTIAVGQRIKIGWAYKSGSNALYINGTLIDSNSTTFTPPSTFDDLFLNDDTTFFAYQEAVQFNQVAIFPTRLTNAQLATLTTI